MQWHGYKFLVPLHPLSNIEITKYFNYGPRFNGVFSGGNLLRIKDGAYAINHDDKQSEETFGFIIYWQTCGSALWFFWNWIPLKGSITQNQR